MQQRLIPDTDLYKVTSMLKEKAPTVFVLIASNKLLFLRNRLDTLRLEYTKTEDIEKREEMLRDAEEIKKQIVFYTL